jgi:hypothetical protein
MTSPLEPQIPNPDGPPVASDRERKTTCKLVSNVVIGAAGGVAAFVVLGIVATPTLGASRNLRVRWEQRRQEIAQSQATSDTQRTAPTEQPHD